MTDLDCLIAYWPVYRDTLTSAKNIDDAEQLLRTHHGIGPMAFQDLMKLVKSAVASAADVEPAKIVT